MEEESGVDKSLFRLVDASDVEATVLRDAEKRARDATIPVFTVARGLGFGAASLGKFCADVDPLILRMAADATRHEGQQLRENGVANLATRDKVHMKEQILNGLLRRRDADEDEWRNNESLGSMEELERASPMHGDKLDLGHGGMNGLGDERRRTEELIKTGAITPLDVGTDNARPPSRIRGRVSMMEHKIAEGMAVKLPRARRAKIPSPQQANNDDSGHDSSLSRKDGGTDKVNSRQRESPVDSATDVMDGEEEVIGRIQKRQSRSESNRANTVECPICEQRVIVEDPAHPDACLSKHMDRCDRRKGRGKTKGQAKDGKDAEEGVSRQARPLSERGGRRNREGTRDGVGNRAKTPSDRPGEPSAGKNARGGKRRKASTRKVPSQQGSGSSDVDVEPEARQEVIDDYEDVDFEARQDQVHETLSAVVDEDNGFADGVAELGDGLAMDSSIANRLFQYQLTGVRWMWQLHRQGAGGIIGDEMGLGKTVQVASYLGALHRGGVARRMLVLCPATVLSHWMSELHTWAPRLRVVVLHRCVQAFNAVAGNSGKTRSFVRRVLDWPNVVVVASYEGMKMLKTLLLPYNWDYSILDEGQRIRNPDAEVTLICKQIRTVHRLILTGTPIQNNLRELWSLFDFVFPGRLGTLPAFEAEFANPIRVGGYANASPMQVRLAYRCALVLRDLIHPYLLRRLKKDLEDIIKLPQKTEQVLFCRLTSYQRHLYSEFLDSTEVKNVLSRTMRAFRAIGILRKLCNHPDLACKVGESVATRFALNSVWTKESDGSGDEEDIYEEAKDSEHGAPIRSGKLQVLKQILPLWHEQGHRVLLFSQTRQMLNILEKFVKSMGWSYGRLDGNTPVGKRQNLIRDFNGNDSMFIMLLTTRTGGVGVNLTGADRVILFDPDWNPSTDMQARERSWRVGQLRQVTVYRLITAGTIEEKIYHRQIFKTALTNRVLQDPKQRRMFSADELGDLFTLGDDGSTDGFTDTVDLFQGEGKVDAPSGDRQESNGRRSKKKNAGGGKHRGNSAGSRNRRSRSPKRSDDDAEDDDTEPSALLGTATVVLEPGHEAGDNADDTDAGGGDDKTKSDDAAVLQALYEGAPLSGVFRHDLAEGGGVMSVEQKRMEEEAKRAAQRAVNQLRISRQNDRAGAGQGGFHSSWTGRNGGASQRQTSSANGSAGRRFGNVVIPGLTIGGSRNGSSGNDASTDGQSTGMSSQDVLRHIRERSQAQPAQAPGLFPEFQASAGSSSKDAHYSALLQRLENYLADAPSGIDTAALIQAFRDVPREDVPVFRQLLQALAVCNNGRWKLREVPAVSADD